MAVFGKKDPKPQPENKKYLQEVPVVDGVQASLVWVKPFTNSDANYYMPPGDYTADTDKNFRKVMKDYFQLDFEGNWQDVISRLVVTNRTTKDFVQKYAADMEELDLMPNCKEKFEKKAAAADELQKGLLYEMAKGALAIFKPGENQPRQIRCDKDPKVMVVTEPLSDCFIGEIQKKYQTPFKPRPLPREIEKPHPPKPFTEPEPKGPDMPQPVSLKHPGQMPKENRIKKRPEDLKPVENILKDKTRDQLVDELYKEKLAKYTEGLIKPEKVVEKPVLEVEDPGEFKEKPPREIKVPDKPAACDIAQAMQEEAAKIDTSLDPKYFRINFLEPGEFDLPEPRAPQIDEPHFPDDPEYRPVTNDKPVMKYIFDKPQLKLLEPEGLEKPVEPKLDLSDLKEPVYPELRDEPAEPGFFKRLFSRFNSDWKKQAADHDSWVRERDELPKRREEWEKEYDIYNEKVVIRTEKYRAELEKFVPKKMAYAEAAQELEPDNEMLRIQHEMSMRSYEQDLEKLGGKPYTDAKKLHLDNPDDPKYRKDYEDMRKNALMKLQAEKIDYEQKLKLWEEKNKVALAENKKIKEAYDAKVNEYELRHAEYVKNYEGCKTPEEHKARRQYLEEVYQEDRQYYDDQKKRHEEAVETYKSQLEKCAEHARQHGIDPEEALAANRDRVQRQKQSDMAYEAVGQFISDHPEIGEYDLAVAEAEDEEIWRGVYENRLEDWKEEKAEYEQAKKEYEQKLAAYEDFSAASETYKQKYKEADIKALLEARREVDEAISKNREALATFEERNAANKKEQEVWDRENERVNENNRKMHEPGGLIYRWHENVKAYEDDVKRYNREVVKYKNDLNALPQRRSEWQLRKNAHDQEMIEFEAKKKIYDKRQEEIEAVKRENQMEKGSLESNDLRNPLYRDYMQRSSVAGYNHWRSYMDGNFKMDARQGVDLVNESKNLKLASKQYQKEKKNAPVKPSSKEQQDYIKRIQDRDRQIKLAEKEGIQLQNMNPFLS